MFFTLTVERLADRLGATPGCIFLTDPKLGSHNIKIIKASEEDNCINSKIGANLPSIFWGARVSTSRGTD